LNQISPSQLRATGGSLPSTSIQTLKEQLQRNRIQDRRRAIIIKEIMKNSLKNTKKEAE
jgi:predicted RNA binding protein with dsRBD fold (UPF0201 family)